MNVQLEAIPSMGLADLLNEHIRQIERNASRYAWLRLNPAFETEAVLSGVSPEEFDALVDKAMRAE